MKNGFCEVTNYSKSALAPGVPEVHVKTVMHGRGDPGYLLTASKHLASAASMFPRSYFTFEQK